MKRKKVTLPICKVTKNNLFHDGGVFLAHDLSKMEAKLGTLTYYEE
ncbi:UNVERIFIED_CONTAM: hypothetical protein BJ099_11831 [Lysinibacillus xylanilyticus]